MLQKENMETLFAQGVRVTYADREEAEQKMKIIDSGGRRLESGTDKATAVPRRKSALGGLPGG